MKKKNVYYSGMGIIYLAAYNKSGKLGEFFDFGNASKLNLDAEGNVEIVFESISHDNLELIFGGESRKSSVRDFLDVGEFKTKHKNRKITVTEISTKVERDYALVFEGINSIDSVRKNKKKSEFDSFLRIEINRLQLVPKYNILLLGDNMAEFGLIGKLNRYSKSSAYFIK